ncbi:GNAT family N-acetyltransferase [Leeuwenhoekiella nanhaiensis]|uniref:N-acetyltransferase domain-containing protein n=1 Tax=Leeuwenhoekiella nanhaiensis TaxID=1655491 RepID=A0A2G1VT94_9FLAO|nr:GNAT family N-acetyltransferase [Leeuwenhoekiella nanhaiensis]PHQ30013.1 hypothetical protein CJ305_08615 [Leeuwenhoekiella nanhaiensis]
MKSQSSFEVKPLGERDWPVLKSLVDRVWPVTFKDILSEEQIAYMMEFMYSTASLKKQVETGSRFYILYEAAEPIGYLALIPNYRNEKLTKEGSWMKVDKLYVMPENHGTGAGRFLMDFAFAEANKENVQGVMLNVNRDNKAVKFYEYYGFKTAYSGDFDIGKGYLMQDYIMVYPFKE